MASRCASLLSNAADVPHSPAARARTVLEAMRPLVDIESRNRIRKVTVVPLTIAVSAITEFGRTDATSAILRACNKASQATPQPTPRESLTADPMPHAVAEEVGNGDRARGQRRGGSCRLCS